MPKRKRGKGPLKVTPRATLPPEILGMIFYYLMDDRVIRWRRDLILPKLTRKASVPAIFTCLFVNSMWFNEAVRLLWQHPTIRNRFSLAHCFENILQSRQQFYANLVRHSNLVDQHKRGHSAFGNTRKYIDALYGLTFPQMHTLDVIFDVHQCGDNIPWIHAPTVTLLSVHFCRYNAALAFYDCQKSRRKILQTLICLIKVTLTFLLLATMILIDIYF